MGIIIPTRTREEELADKRFRAKFVLVGGLILGGIAGYTLGRFHSLYQWGEYVTNTLPAQQFDWDENGKLESAEAEAYRVATNNNSTAMSNKLRNEVEEKIVRYNSR